MSLLIFKKDFSLSLSLKNNIKKGFMSVNRRASQLCGLISTGIIAFTEEDDDDAARVKPKNLFPYNISAFSFKIFFPLINICNTCVHLMKNLL